MTARQLETLAYIDAYQQASGGVSPSFAEIRDRLGLEARSGVFRLVDALEARGHIRRLRHRARAIEVIRSEEHTSELQSLMRISSAVFCLTKKNEHIVFRLYIYIKHTYNTKNHEI